ncbi:transposase [Streptomyces vastus]|uniref:Insertion element IS402-like domain-containing protein n=1 Tax=Streptomyces vastus TaxID=285451 RepID=A0ABP6E837_9ACTN
MVDHGEVIRRHELTDEEWELLAPLIPRAATGRPRVSDPQVINGMVYKIRTGIFWRQHAAATDRKGGSTDRTNRTITPSADPEADWLAKATSPATARGARSQSW